MVSTSSGSSHTLLPLGHEILYGSVHSRLTVSFQIVRIECIQMSTGTGAGELRNCRYVMRKINNRISYDHVVPYSETRMGTNVNMHRGRSGA
jgi:hypothetical protein